MKRLILFCAFALLISTNLQAGKPKRYGFTATFRVPHTSKQILLDSTLSWVRENLPTTNFYLRDIDEKEGYVTYRATNKGDFGKVTYDLTFYAKKNVVDVVADNVEHSKSGRLPRALRTKGTPKRKVKTYLTYLSDGLGQHLRKIRTHSRFTASLN